MFDSGITTGTLIEQVKDEADIALSLPNSSYVLWLNAAEQLLYSEVIKEQRMAEYTVPENFNNVITLSSLTHVAGEDFVKFEDIYAVYADEKQLIKSTLTSGVIFPDTYFKTAADNGHNNLGLNLSDVPEKIKIIYFVRPEPKTSATSTINVKLPVEFLELIKAKIRGEAYKAANEDALAAKWINDYNVLLETFKAYLAARQPEFGI